MWLTLIITLLLVVVVFGFVLEPIVRGRADRAHVDSVSVPDTVNALGPDVPAEAIEGPPAPEGVELARVQQGALATDAGRTENGS